MSDLIPVRSRSVASSLTSHCRPSVDARLNSSTSELNPGRMMPPSPVAALASSRMDSRIRLTASGTGSTADRSSARRGETAPSMTSRKPAAASSEAAMARRSLGPQVPQPMRPHVRSKSYMRSSAARTSPRINVSPASSSTESSRALISSAHTDGRSSQARTSLPPMGVSVSSSARARPLSRPNRSRARRVGPSTCMNSPRW